MGLRWFRQRYDGRPRPFPDGARAIRREACACGSIPEILLLRRRVRPSSKEHSSLLPLRVLISIFPRLRCAWRVGCGEVLMCCWLANGGFAVVAGTATLCGMDSVRFGRVLGIGARLAAKTMVSAVEAATAPNPSAAAKAKVSVDAASGSAAASASTAASGQEGVSRVPLAQQAART